MLVVMVMLVLTVVTMTIRVVVVVLMVTTNYGDDIDGVVGVRHRENSTNV